MAATPKKTQVIKLDYAIDKEIYDNFIRTCVKTRYSPKVVIEKLIKKYTDGQVTI
ncbi:MAG: hypothetical protein ABIJ34_02185 [archaeon]